MVYAISTAGRCVSLDIYAGANGLGFGRRFTSRSATHHRFAVDRLRQSKSIDQLQAALALRDYSLVGGMVDLRGPPERTHMDVPYLTAALSLNECNDFSEVFVQKSPQHMALYHHARRAWGDPRDAVHCLFGLHDTAPAQVLPVPDPVAEFDDFMREIADRTQEITGVQQPTSPLTDLPNFGDWA